MHLTSYPPTLCFHAANRHTLMRFTLCRCATRLSIQATATTMLSRAGNPHPDSHQALSLRQALPLRDHAIQATATIASATVTDASTRGCARPPSGSLSGRTMPLDAASVTLPSLSAHREIQLQLLADLLWKVASAKLWSVRAGLEPIYTAPANKTLTT